MLYLLLRLSVCLKTMDPKVQFCFIPELLTFIKAHLLTATEEGDFIYRVIFTGDSLGNFLYLDKKRETWEL